MRIQFAIPSYRRPFIILKKTLAFLSRMKVPAQDVTIFVATIDECRLYEAAFEDTPWFDRIIVGQPTLRAQRNFIRNWYPEGTRLVCIDDDLRNLIVLNPGLHKGRNEKGKLVKRKDQSHFIQPAEFRRLIERGFQECLRRGFQLWGVYPTNNPMFLSRTITTDLRYISGVFWGMIVQHEHRLHTFYPIKEDYERTLRYFCEQGGVVRLNWVGIDTSYWGSPGGLHADGMEARIKLADETVDRLLKEFPYHARPKTRRGMKDVELLRNSSLCVELFRKCLL